MKDPALASSSRLGGAVISDRVVASLLEELTNGRYAQADRLPAEVTFSFVDTSNPDNVRNAIQDNTRLILTETPANPTLKLTVRIRRVSVPAWPLSMRCLWRF